MGPLASLWPCEVDVELGGFVYTLPAHPASVWVDAISQPDGAAIMPGLLNETDQREVWRDFLRGTVQPADLNEAWRAVLEAAAGRKWWEVAGLVLDAVKPDVWPVIHGRLTREGIDLDTISLGALWNAIYVMALENCADEDARTQFKFKLSTPPPGYAADAHDAEAAADDFMAAMSTLQRLQG